MTEPTLAERLAPMTLSQIDAMTDREVAELMGATPDEIAQSEAAGEMWTWRESAKAATDEYAERLQADVASGEARVITDPEELTARGRGRPPLGDGDSVQIRARLTQQLARQMDALGERTGRRRSDIVRDALAEYLERHAG